MEVLFMDIKLFFTRKKLVALIFIGLLLCFIYFVSKRSTIIDDPVPLSSGQVEAMFYVEESNSPVCLGDGLISTTEETSGEDAVKSKIITAPDNSASFGNNYHVVWNSIRRTDDGLKVYGYLADGPSPSKDIVSSFTNIEELKASTSLKAGDKVTTKGFYSSDDSGGATYKIIAKPQLNENPYTTFKLANGLFAELDFNTDSMIRVPSVGVTAGTECAAQLNQIFKLLQYKVHGFQFSKGTYFIEEPLYLRSFAYYGDDTTLQITPNFNKKEVNCILTLKSNDRPYEIEMHNMNFLMETGPASSLYNEKSVLVALRYIGSCVIDHCNFVARPFAENGGFQIVHMLWFKQTDLIQNVTITNCEVINDSAKNYSGSASDNLLGGGLLFSGPNGNYSTPINNITIKNCNIESTINDENLSFWNGNFTNVLVDNCTISNSDHPSNNLVTFYRGEFHNVVVNNCKINAMEPTKNVIKYRELVNASDLTFNGTDILLDSETSDPNSNSISFFKCDSDLTNYGDVTTATFNDCTIEATDTTVYGTLFKYTGLNNKQLNLNDCEISGTTRYGHGSISGSNDIEINFSNTTGMDESSIRRK